MRFPTARACLTWLIPGLILACALHAPAQSPAPTTVPEPGALSSAELDQSIEEVVSRPEYSWRMPRRRTARKSMEFESELWERFMKRIRDFFRSIEDFFDRLGNWLERKFSKRDTSGRREIDWRSVIQGLLFILLAVVSCILGVLIYRMIRDRGKKGDVTARPVKDRPDITDEDVSAADLPPDEWMQMAQDFLDRGELRLALRAMFLSCLATLAHRDHIVLAAHKSNREYIREITRKAHDRPRLVEAFTGNVGIVERVWYGDHMPDQGTVAQFQQNHDDISSEGRSS